MREGVDVTAARTTEDPNEHRFRELRDLPHGRERMVAKLRRRDRPDAPQRFDREPVQELQLGVGRDDQQAVGLGDAARHLGEELGPGDPDRDRKADLLQELPAQSHRDLGRRARDPPQPTDVQEGLVDREPFDERRRVVEHLEHRLACPAIGIHPRTNDDRLRAQPAS